MRAKKIIVPGLEDGRAVHMLLVFLDEVLIPCQNIDGLTTIDNDTITVSSWCDDRIPTAWTRTKLESLGYPVEIIAGNNDDIIGRATLTIKQKGIGL